MAELDLPASVLVLTEQTPMEDIALAVLRDGLPDMPVFSLIPEDPPSAFILVRKRGAFGGWGGDERFIDQSHVDVEVYTTDPDGDEKGAVVSEAVRVVMREASRLHKRYPGLGVIVKISLTADPSRKTDWATSSGPVQFADLPTGFWRYESSYRFTVRRR